MSKRLQVLFDEPELRDIQRAARRQRMTVAEWVRHALREARRRQPATGADRKRAALRAALRHQHPTADIEQMIDETTRGYLADSVR
jgi:hypothetical protein